MHIITVRFIISVSFIRKHPVCTTESYESHKNFFFLWNFFLYKILPYTHLYFITHITQIILVKIYIKKCIRTRRRRILIKKIFFSYNRKFYNSRSKLMLYAYEEKLLIKKKWLWSKIVRVWIRKELIYWIWWLVARLIIRYQ